MQSHSSEEGILIADLADKGSDDNVRFPLMDESESIKARNDITETMSLLQDDTRIKILEVLSSNGPTCVTDLCALLGEKYSQPAVSHHIALLKDAGILNFERRGKFILYSISPSIGSRILPILERIRKIFEKGSAASVRKKEQVTELSAKSEAVKVVLAEPAVQKEIKELYFADIQRLDRITFSTGVWGIMSKFKEGDFEIIVQENAGILQLAVVIQPPKDAEKITLPLRSNVEKKILKYIHHKMKIRPYSC